MIEGLKQQKLDAVANEVSFLEDQFPFQDFSDDEDQEEEESITFFLWESNSKVFEIYKVLSWYLDKDLTLPSSACLALLQEAFIPLKQGMEELAYIHGEYATIVLAYRQSQIQEPASGD